MCELPAVVAVHLVEELLRPFLLINVMHECLKLVCHFPRVPVGLYAIE